MKKLLLLLAAIFAAALPVAAQSQATLTPPSTTAAPDKKAEKPKPVPYFDPATFDARAVLPNPPPNDSLETTHELETILQDQSVRTQEQVDRIKSEEHYNVFVFGNVVPWLSKDSVDQLPLATALLARVMETAKPIVVSSKDDWKRPRPFLANSRVFPAIDKPKDPSYPSGHSTRATLDALVLAELSPTNAGAIKKRGMEVGDDRVIAGVHYPSDVLAGRKMAQAIYDRMMQEKDFRDELKAAQDEVKAYEQKGGH